MMILIFGLVVVFISCVVCCLLVVLKCWQCWVWLQKLCIWQFSDFSKVMLCCMLVGFSLVWLYGVIMVIFVFGGISFFSNLWLVVVIVMLVYLMFVYCFVWWCLVGVVVLFVCVVW